MLVTYASHTHHIHITYASHTNHIQITCSIRITYTSHTSHTHNIHHIYAHIRITYNVSYMHHIRSTYNASRMSHMPHIRIYQASHMSHMHHIICHILITYKSHTISLISREVKCNTCTEITPLLEHTRQLADHRF